MTADGERYARGSHDLHEAALPAELASALAEIVPPGGSFRHREHIHLAYLAVQRHGADRAAGVVSGWIRQLAVYQRAPQKFNATVTRAWTEIVAHHMAAAPPTTNFASFADRYPALLDKRLLTRHYTARTLASPAARTGWAEPDLLPFPWRDPSDGAATVPPPKGRTSYVGAASIELGKAIVIVW